LTPLPIQRAAAFGESDKRRATVTAAALSAALRRPMRRSAQLTPFLTKLRSSVAARSMSSSPSRKAASPVRLSCSAKQASSANAARLTNSSRRSCHSPTFAQANSVRSKRWKQTVSQIPQLSKSRHQRSICRGVTRAGSSTNELRSRASYQPDAQSSAARS
jgi:hypothetical protein